MKYYLAAFFFFQNNIIAQATGGMGKPMGSVVDSATYKAIEYAKACTGNHISGAIPVVQRPCENL